MSKFQPKYNWGDRPVAKVLPNGDFDAHRWEWARHWAVETRKMHGIVKELLGVYKFDYTKHPLSNTEEISGEAVWDAL